jgi:hypothetical protein
MQQTAACDDCLVTCLYDEATPVEFIDAEVTALHELARAGLVAPLRLVPRSGDPSSLSQDDPTGGTAHAGSAG